MSRPEQLGHASRGKLIFALDYPDLASARHGAQSVSRWVGTVKVGPELFIRHGPVAAALGAELGAEVFLDLKLHDIPATVERAVRSVAKLPVRYLTVHAGGGPEMLRRAAAAAVEAEHPLHIVAVTALTSLDASDLAAVGVDSAPHDQVLRLAELALRCGVETVVCSPAETAALRLALGEELRIITPGVRPTGDRTGDQKRVATPAAAIAAGADMLVVGRPIREATDPARAAQRIAAEVEAALAGA